jgi:hypothetical protein
VSENQWAKLLKREEILPVFAGLTFTNNLAGLSVPGKHRLVITVTDRIRNKSSTCEFPFETRLPD